ncbi:MULTISPECIES: hypothetical protein [Micromonospora]|uniref:Ig-like domain-containing protein n=1 Tax=Micromonospora lupini str. Lupac 08 TaxID=1150864 RepID=I0L929_9ACTN|nr:hypothetical protein [Micromonospora lupini]CCH20326.1 exported hypothetical protein [Micromonospora lupini str. Lupac 08]
MNPRRLLAACAVTVTAAVGLVATPAFAGGTFQTKTDLNLRYCQWLNNSQCSVILTIPKGQSVYLNCWAPGSSVNGDTVWYNAFYGNASGMLAGDYMNTGHDPNPAVYRCV